MDFFVPELDEKLTKESRDLDGPPIFKVIDKKAPRTLHFEEVRDKVYRVILSSKENELYNELQEKTLEGYHFTFMF